MKTQLLFIDSTVQNPQHFTQNLHPEVEAFIIPPHQDFIEEITKILTQYSQIKALHLVSHGEDGQLQLGQTHLNSDTLKTYSPILQKWHQFLVPNTDFLLIGCNVAQTSKGQAFVQQFSQLTATQIAASRHPIGNPQLGGSWDLDYQTGPVKTPIPFSQKTQDTYANVLATFEVSQPTDDGTGVTEGTLSWAIQQANQTPEDDIINLSTNVRLSLDSGLRRMQTLIDGNVSIVGVDDNITISGDNDGDGTVDLNGEDRPLLFIQSGNVSLQNLTLTGGVAKGGSSLFGGGGAGLGGALFINSGNVTLDNVTFEDNYAIGGDAGFGGYGGGGLSGDSLNFQGGGLFADGSLDNGTGQGEDGDFGEGGYLGNGNLDSNITGGNGGFGGGGGSGQNADGGNGGFGGGGGYSYNGNGGDGGFGGGGGRSNGVGGFGGGDGDSSAGGGGAGFGGAIFIREGTLSIQNSTFNNNNAQEGQGGEGSEDGQGLGGAIFVPDEATGLPNLPTLSLSNVNFNDNTATEGSNNIYGNANQAPNFVETLNLYENLNVTPDNPAATENGSWLEFGTIGEVIPEANGTFTTFDTTLELETYAGYGNYTLLSDDLVNPQFPTLNQDTGYSVNFTARVVSEENAGSDRNGDDRNDRAGFSVTAISNDNTKAIELGFEDNQIWAQEGGTSATDPLLFTQAEGVAFDTTSGLVDYELRIFDDTYTLSADGNSILSGQLRDYTAFENRLDPYELPNFLFFGDNTTSAQAEIELGPVSVTTVATNGALVFEVAENAENGFIIGQVEAIDPDGDSLTYSIISGNETNIFAIDETTGEITLADSNSLDFETQAAYTFSVEVSDGNLSDTINIDVNLTDVNEVPTFSSPAITTATEDDLYTYNITATDPDGDVISINSTVLPDWLSFTDNGDGTAILTGTPTPEQVGIPQAVQLQVSDGELTEIQDFNIAVDKTNNAPIILSEGTNLAFNLAENAANNAIVGEVTATDPDGDAIIYNISSGNENNIFAINPNTGEITLADNSSLDFETQAAYTFSVEVSDGNLSDTINIDVNLTDVNEVPTFSSPAITTATEDDLYTYNITATDPDADVISINSIVLPDWLSFTDNGDGTAILTGTPTNEQVGTPQTVQLQVTDGELTEIQDFNIAVNNTNDAPTISGTPATSVDENSPYNFLPIANDIDGDLLTFSIENLPSWAAFNTETGEVSGTPTDTDIGTTLDIIIGISDGVEIVSLPAFNLTVNEVINSPSPTP
ncbi:MAG: DUF4347 domain-containing protein, partial [Cyanobacteria bacterium J06592_8]